jgi:ribosome-binding protein aMBF1 (putative translation factor)
MTTRAGRRTFEEHDKNQWTADGATVDDDQTLSIGQRIADARRARRLTQEALAQRSTVSVSLLRTSDRSGLVADATHVSYFGTKLCGLLDRRATA